jgi:predicted nucleotidyltransferase
MNARNGTSRSVESKQEELVSEEFLTMLRAHGVVRASIFGSMALGTAGPESDIDLLVIFDGPVTLFDQLRLAERLREVSGREIDLMTELHPAFAPAIIPTLVPLPL